MQDKGLMLVDALFDVETLLAKINKLKLPVFLASDLHDTTRALRIVVEAGANTRRLGRVLKRLARLKARVSRFSKAVIGARGLSNEI